MNHLLQTEMTSQNIYHTRMHIDDLFMKFDEHHGLDIFKLGNAFNIIANQVAHLPKESKQYFTMIETFQSGNETYFQDLPTQLENATIEQLQFTVNFFTLLNELLEKGMMAKDIYQAHQDINDLLKSFEEQTEELEDRIKANTPAHFTPYPGLEALTIFSKTRGTTYATV
jgi:hypothetical protein